MTASSLPTLSSPHLLLETSCMKEPLGLDGANPQDVPVCRLAFTLRAGGSPGLLTYRRRWVLLLKGDLQAPRTDGSWALGGNCIQLASQSREMKRLLMSHRVEPKGRTVLVLTKPQVHLCQPLLLALRIQMLGWKRQSPPYFLAGM